MSDQVVIRLDTEQLDRIAAYLDKGVEKVITSLAFDIEASAKQKAPVRTGALRASIYTATRNGNRLPAVVKTLYRKSQRKRGTKTVQVRAYRRIAEMQIEPHPTPSGNVIARVGPCVEYGAFVEFGHHGGKGKRPYLIPAFEEQSGKINDGSKWRELFEGQK